MNIVVSVDGTEYTPDRFSISSGLSMIYLFPSTSRIGIALNPTKVLCAECNTPIAEVNGGSLIIRSKHHSQRHVTHIALNDLNQLIQ